MQNLYIWSLWPAICKAGSIVARMWKCLETPALSHWVRIAQQDAGIYLENQNSSDLHILKYPLYQNPARLKVANSSPCGTGSTAEGTLACFA
jgi:hypothetical protein